MLIKNARVLCGDFALHNWDLRVEGRYIAEVGPNLSGDNVIDASACTLLPGLIDIHTHGCVGYDTCDGDPAGYAKMCSYYASRGVTAFLFTSMTLAPNRIKLVFETINHFYCTDRDGAQPWGIYLEGPFISAEKHGAQDSNYIAPPQKQLLEDFHNASGNRIKVVAIAPEVAGAPELISWAKDHRYTVTLAHTAADYDTAINAIERGATQVTHLYNAMNIPTHRSPGLPGAAFDKGINVELICDGIHVHPSVVRTTFKAAGYDKVILISDSMQAAGMPDGKFQLGGQEVFVADGKATLSDGTLAGSCTNLLSCLENIVKWGIPFEQAVKAATINPAVAIGISNQTGSIKPGKLADLLLIDHAFNVRTVFVHGEIAYQKENQKK